MCNVISSECSVYDISLPWTAELNNGSGAFACGIKTHICGGRLYILENSRFMMNIVSVEYYKAMYMRPTHEVYVPQIQCVYKDTTYTDE